MVCGEGEQWLALCDGSGVDSILGDRWSRWGRPGRRVREVITLPKESRYEIHVGKWGAYFHDKANMDDLSLIEVCSLLNAFVPVSVEMKDVCPECRRPKGEGAGYWCYECSLLAGIVE